MGNNWNNSRKKKIWINMIEIVKTLTYEQNWKKNELSGEGLCYFKYIIFNWKVKNTFKINTLMNKITWCITQQEKVASFRALRIRLALPVAERSPYLFQVIIIFPSSVLSVIKKCHFSLDLIVIFFLGSLFTPSSRAEVSSDLDES